MWPSCGLVHGSGPCSPSWPRRRPRRHTSQMSARPWPWSRASRELTRGGEDPATVPWPPPLRWRPLPLPRRGHVHDEITRGCPRGFLSAESTSPRSGLADLLAAAGSPSPPPPPAASSVATCPRPTSSETAHGRPADASGALPQCSHSPAQARPRRRRLCGRSMGTSPTSSAAAARATVARSRVGATVDGGAPELTNRGRHQKAQVRSPLAGAKGVL